MSAPAPGLVAALREAMDDKAMPEDTADRLAVHTAQVASAWLADHLDTLAESDDIGHGHQLFLGQIADELRTAGGVA